MRRIRRLAGAILVLVVLVLCLAAGAIVFLLGTETGERFVQAQTTAALSRLLGPRYEASLGGQQFELRLDGTLAINWYDVALHRKDRPERESRVERVSVAVRLMPLVGGSVEFGRLEIAGAVVDLSAFASPQRPAANSAPSRAPGGSVMARTVDVAVAAVERQLQALKAFHFDTLSLQRIEVSGLAKRGGPWSAATLETAELHRALDGSLRLFANLKAGSMPLVLSGTAEFDPVTENLTRFAARSGRIDVASLLPPAAVDDLKDERPFGSDVETWFDLSLERPAADDEAVVRVSANVGPGHVQLGLNRTEVESVMLDLSYRRGDDRIVVERSPFRFQDVAFDLQGELEQTNRTAVDEAPRFDFRLAAPEIRSSVGQDARDATPLSAGIEVKGSAAPMTRNVMLSSAVLKTGAGTLQGQGAYDGSSADARTHLDLTASDLAASSVKAFWPFMISGKARKWVLAHLSNDGTVPGGTISLDLERDRLGPAFKPGESPTENELQVDVSVSDAALSTIGELPRLHGVNGTITVRGSRTEIAVREAAVEGLDDVAIQPSTVVLQRPAEGNKRDLQMSIDIAATGAAKQLLRIADRDPIHAFRNVPIEIDPFTGRATAKVSAGLRLGDEVPKERQVQNWNVEADLEGVDPGQPIEGRRFAALDGVVHVIPGQASGSLDGTMDDMPAKLIFAMPFGEKPVGERSVEVDLKVPSAKAVELIPALDGVIKGPIAAHVTDDAEGMRAKLDLGQAQFDLPAVAWKKGAGISAALSFAVRKDGATTELRDLDLDGDGFNANGTILVNEKGLLSANLSKVALNPGDDVAVDVKRHGNGFGIQVKGDRFDARPILAEIKAGVGRDKKGRVGGGTFDIAVDVGRLDGFNGRAVSGFSLNYASVDGQMAALNLGGAIGGNQLSGDLSPREELRRIRIASEDVGALLGFAGLYGHMQGGQGALSLLGSSNEGYSGEIKITNFNLVDEPRLSSIVGSSPVKGTASLSQAVGQDLRTERAFFDHASAKLAYGGGTLRVAEGIVRGPIFGSSFAGTIYDPNGQIDISGSFMPAYGINRVFGAIPILGQILGNGQEGGLIGITYRLSGAMSAPSLVVNPISAIAPGIFRQIFAFD